MSDCALTLGATQASVINRRVDRRAIRFKAVVDVIAGNSCSLGIGRESISGSTDHNVVDAANKRIVAEGYEEVKKKCFEMNH